MSQRSFTSIVSALVIISLCSLVPASNVKASQNTVVSAELDARSAIAVAEQRIVVCYQAVADADRAGANTSTLLTVLNEAGESLSRAKLAYKMGDFDSALSYGLETQTKLDGFVESADSLRATAIQQHNWDFMINVVGSIVGTIAVICVSSVVWIILKKRVLRLEA